MANYQTEPRYGIRYPAPGAALPDYETYIKSLATDVGVKTAGYLSGASLPAAGIEGRVFRRTDGVWFLDNGSVWSIMLVAGAWQPVSYINGWTGSVRCRQEGDIIRLSGAAQNQGGGTADTNGLFVIPFAAPAAPADYYTQVIANANPVLFTIQTVSGYGTALIINPYTQDGYAPNGSISVEGWTYSLD